MKNKIKEKKLKLKKRRKQKKKKIKQKTDKTGMLLKARRGKNKKINGTERK